MGIVFGLGWESSLRRITSEVGSEHDRLCDDMLLLEGGCGKRGGGGGGGGGLLVLCVVAVVEERGDVESA